MGICVMIDGVAIKMFALNKTDLMAEWLKKTY